MLVGPCEYKVSLTVVDIPAIFNLLLGWPWIHTAGAIPSSLHWKVKFILGNKLISAVVEEDLPVPASMVPFFDA